MLLARRAYLDHRAGGRVFRVALVALAGASTSPAAHRGGVVSVTVVVVVVVVVMVAPAVAAARRERRQVGGLEQR
jgi:hypothetical protein